MGISDWSSAWALPIYEAGFHFRAPARHQGGQPVLVGDAEPAVRCGVVDHHLLALVFIPEVGVVDLLQGAVQPAQRPLVQDVEVHNVGRAGARDESEGGQLNCRGTIVDDPLGHAEEILVVDGNDLRSEEHTSELQSLMRISYAVFCLKQKKTYIINTNNTPQSKH